jgi:hypothetical protein
MQETGWGQSEAESEMWDKPYSLSIQDNSFLIEEAFNQEGGRRSAHFKLWVCFSTYRLNTGSE